MSGKGDLKDIERILEMHKKELEERFGIGEIGIFGSYVRNEQREDSDIDILVDFHPSAEPDLIDFIRIEEYLSELLGKKVDLVMKSALKPRIGRQILKEVVYI